MALLTWDPVRGLVVLRGDADGSSAAGCGWTPPVDIVETADAFVISAEIAGVRPEDVRIEVRDGHVTLEGVRAAPAERPEQYHRIERGHGRFARTFALPQSADATAVRADAADGVLVVTIPKARRQDGRRVPIE